MAGMLKELFMRINISRAQEEVYVRETEPLAQWGCPFYPRSDSRAIPEAATPAPTASRIPDHPYLSLCQTELFRQLQPE